LCQQYTTLKINSVKNEEKETQQKTETKYKTKSMKWYNISMFYHTCILDEIEGLIDWMIN
jgi:hypothetical protein